MEETEAVQRQRREEQNKSTVTSKFKVPTRFVTGSVTNGGPTRINITQPPQEQKKEEG